MRILMVHNFHRFGGGSDDSVVKTIDTLRQAGHSVSEFRRDSSDVQKLSSKVSAVATGVYSPSAVRAFRAQLRNFKPDLVHIHEVYPLISPWVLRVASTASVPCVMTCHDYRLTCPIATHYLDGHLCTACLDHGERMCVTNNCRDSRSESTAFALRSYVARATSVFADNISVFVTATTFAKDWLTTRANLDPEVFHVVPYPIPFADSPMDSSNGAYVAYAGRFVQEKGIHTLLEAAQLSGLPVRLAGDPSTMPGLVQSPEVTLVGQLDPARLAEFYRGARFLVVPSTWFETFGIVAGEAMGLGLPIIASRIGALAEVVDDGRTGLLFEPGNASDLAAKMTTLWGEPERCRRMGLAGWTKVRESYSPQSHLTLLLRAYEHALEVGPRPVSAG